MESLKLSLLLLSLAILGSAEGWGCFSRKTEMKILSGSFKGVSDKVPLVQIQVLNPNSKTLETTAVRSFSPVWDQTLEIKAVPRGFPLFARINNGKPVYICYVTSKTGNGSCDKKRGQKHYSIKYFISC